jgi:hypothetical protein
MPSAVSSTRSNESSAPSPAPRPPLPPPARALAGRRRGGHAGPGAGGGQRLSVQQHQPRPATAAGIGDRARGRPVRGPGLPARRAVITGGGRGGINQKWPRTSPEMWPQPLRARGHGLPAQARGRPRDTRFGRGPGDRIPDPPDPSAHRLATPPNPGLGVTATDLLRRTSLGRVGSAVVTTQRTGMRISRTEPATGRRACCRYACAGSARSRRPPSSRRARIQPATVWPSRWIIGSLPAAIRGHSSPSHP